MKKLFSILAILILLVPLCACPLATANNTIDTTLLNLLRVTKGADRASELIETLYCPPCEPGQRLLSKDAALNTQRALLQIVTYSEKSYQLLKAALNVQTGTLRLTAAARAELESYTAGMAAHIPSLSTPGITSAAAAKLEPLLVPLRLAISSFGEKLGKLKSAVGDAVFEISLSPAQVRRFEALEAEIR